MNVLKKISVAVFPLLAAVVFLVPRARAADFDQAFRTSSHEYTFPEAYHSGQPNPMVGFDFKDFGDASTTQISSIAFNIRRIGTCIDANQGPMHFDIGSEPPGSTLYSGSSVWENNTGNDQFMVFTNINKTGEQLAYSHAFLTFDTVGANCTVSTSTPFGFALADSA